LTWTPSAASSAGQFGLGPHRLRGEQGGDLRLAGRLRRRPVRLAGHGDPSFRRRVAQQPGEEGLLGVEAVLGLVPDHRLRSVKNLGRNLIAAVGGQAVKDDGVGPGQRQGGAVDAVGTEQLKPRRLLLLLAHGDPGVRGDDVGAGEGLRRVGGDEDRAAGQRGPLLRGLDHRGRGEVALRSGDSNVHPCGHSGQQVGIRHVVGGVAEVGEGRPESSPLCSRMVIRSASSWHGW
jgi:hypothetical protein